VNVNSLPGVNDTLALLDAVKKNVREFAAREEKLEADYRQATAAELRDFAARNEEQETLAAEQQAAAEQAREAELGCVRARFARRKEWINRIHATMSRRVLEQIGEQDIQWRDRTQQAVQNAERRRDEELAASTAAHDDLQSRLNEAGDALAELEASVRGAFRGYGKFRRWPAPDRAWPEPDTAADAGALCASLQQLLERSRSTESDLAPCRCH
jgi:hypothetical protein